MSLPPPQQRPALLGPSSAQHNADRWSAPVSGHATAWRPAAEGQLQLLHALQVQTENSTTRLANIESVVGLWQRTFEDLVKAAAAYCDETTGPRETTPRPSRSASADSIINTAATICTDSLRLVRQPSDELLHAVRATTPEPDGCAAASNSETVVPDMFRQPRVLERLQRLRQNRSPMPGEFREIRVDVVGTPTFSFEQQRTSQTELADALALASEDIAQEVEKRLRMKLQTELLDFRTLHKSERVPALQEPGQLEAAGRHLVKRMDDINQLIVEVKHEQHSQSMELISLKAKLDVLGFHGLPNTCQVPCPTEPGPPGVRFRAEVLKAAAVLETRNQASAVAPNPFCAMPQVGTLQEMDLFDAPTTCNISSVESCDVLARIERLEGFCTALPSSASATPKGDATEFRARLEALEAASRVVSMDDLVPHGEVLDLKTRLEVLEKVHHSAAVSTHVAVSSGGSGDMADNADFDRLRMALARTVRHVASLGDDLEAIRAEYAELTRRVDIIGEATAGAAAHSIQRLENALSEELRTKRMQLEKALSIQGQHR